MQGPNLYGIMGQTAGKVRLANATHPRVPHTEHRRHATDRYIPPGGECMWGMADGVVVHTWRGVASVGARHGAAAGTVGR